MNQLHFTDFDQYAAAIRNVDLDVRFIHPHRHHHTWSLTQLELQSIRLQFAVEGSGILALGKMHREGWGLYAQLSGSPVTVNGKRIGPGALAVFPPDAELCIVGQGEISWFSLFIPRQLLVDDAESTKHSSSAYVAKGQAKLFNKLYTQAESFRRCLQRPDFSLLSSSDFSLVHDDLLSTVREVLWEQGNPTSTYSLANARRLTAKAVQLIHECPDLKLSVRELAMILNVSERTLQFTFRDQFAVSPQSFLINYRLHQARRSLLYCDPRQTTVAMVAANYGFLDFGRFAAKYQGLFGEYPSATLRRPT